MQQRLHEHASMLRHTYIAACLVLPELQFSPVTIIPPTFHTHLHLDAASLIGWTSARSLVILRAQHFRKVWSTGSKQLHVVSAIAPQHSTSCCTLVSAARRFGHSTTTSTSCCTLMSAARRFGHSTTTSTSCCTLLSAARRFGHSTTTSTSCCTLVSAVTSRQVQAWNGENCVVYV